MYQSGEGRHIRQRDISSKAVSKRGINRVSGSVESSMKAVSVRLKDRRKVSSSIEGER